MTSSDRTCSQLREYLSSRDPTFTASGAPSAHAGQHMMERLLRTYFWWKGGLGDMARNLRGSKSQPMTRNPSAAKKPAASVRGAETNGRRQPSYKRRRVRGGSVAASVEGGRKAVDEVTGEEKNVGAGLEDEAESIADL
jgi:DNA excision repair protein ERCC-4